ncbi:hypothetical protein [Komagataeibacter diospyri]|uniref:hypothetical protein n=1 Tax=Komagataeibacter diospyri TaxID=1932662 RepID=UPI003756EB86
MLIGAKKKLSLQTREGRDIENECNKESVGHPEIAVSQKLIAQYSRASHRITHPCSTYNCHGLTFASRRTQIWRDEDLNNILKDDGYVEVKLHDVSPGDIVIYRMKDGSFSHSGIVVRKDKKNPDIIVEPRPDILSKWGGSHEVIHSVTDCPYIDGADVTYYRIIK